MPIPLYTSQEQREASSVPRLKTGALDGPWESSHNEDGRLFRRLEQCFI